MMDHKDLKRTLNFLKMRKNKLIILHCISEYPTPIKRAQINTIIQLKSLNTM